MVNRLKFITGIKSKGLEEVFKMAQYDIYVTEEEMYAARESIVLMLDQMKAKGLLKEYDIDVLKDGEREFNFRMETEEKSCEANVIVYNNLVRIKYLNPSNSDIRYYKIEKVYNFYNEVSATNFNETMFGYIIRAFRNINKLNSEEFEKFNSGMRFSIDEMTMRDAREEYQKWSNGDYRND